MTALVSISLTLGYHSCQPHIAKLYQKTQLVSSALIQVEAQIYE